jgi:hypothetical protein
MVDLVKRLWNMHLNLELPLYKKFHIMIKRQEMGATNMKQYKKEILSKKIV